MVITRNQYMILKFLLSNQNKCSYFQLLNQTGCNKEELDAALHDLQYNMRGILRIEKKKEVVKAEIKDKEKLFALMDKKDNILDRNIKEERYNQIVNRLIRYKDKGKGYVSLERLAEDLFISRSTLIKDMSVVKHSISAYQLSIKGITKKGITINGNETNIRLFILNHFFQLYRDSQAHPVCLHNRILYLIEEIANHFMIDQHTKEIFERVIQITIIRCGFNQHILQSTAYFHSSYQEDPLLVELKAGISALVEINDYDFEFLCFPLYLGSTKRPRNEKSEVDQMLENMLDRIYTEYQFYLDKVFIDEEIKSHLSYMINRILFHMPPSVSMDEKIEANYPFAYQISKSACDVLEQKLQVHINAQEIAYLALYFQMAIQKKYNASKKFGVVRSTGRSISKLVEDRIRLMFYEGCEFIEIEESQISELNPEEINAIFTLNPIYIDSRIPIILLSNIFDSEYIAHIVNQGEQRTLLANSDIVYHKNIIEVNDRIHAYNQYIIDILANLYKQELINKEFKDVILTLDEKKFSYVSAYMPHAILKGQNKYLLSMTLYLSAKKKQQYQLICLIGIPENVRDGKEFLIVQIYDYIFDIINQFSEASQQRSDLRTVIEKLEKEGNL